MALLAVYFYVSLYGILNTRAELQPEKLFLKTSDVLEVRSLTFTINLLLILQ